MRRLALVPLAITMLLFSPVASALGLGEIEMQSALNQRLDAEIPLRGVPEDDSSRIIVSLASEEAFQQVGLKRPFSLTRMSFEIKRRDSGEYYIQVSSREPIVEPFLSFLIEVDWPQGNLLREYTVLLDPPVFVSDAPEEEAAADMAAEEVSDSMADTDAGVESAEVPESVTTEAAAAPEIEAAEGGEAAMAAAPTPQRTDGDFSDTPMFLQVEAEEEQAEAAARAAAQVSEPEPAPEPAVTSAYDAGGGEYGPVERGEILWNIASRLKSGDMTVQQMMLALLRYNPEAFVDNNINRLKQGYVLRVPEADAVFSLSAQQAVARVREQNALWQEYRRALRGETGRAQQRQQGAADEAVASVSGEDADLRIVGSDEGAGAGTEQEASATAGGSAQPAEELKLARERLESARMEKAELQSRVDELEQTVGKMERLIELREDQLAKLQEQLRALEEDAAVDEAADEAAATEAAEQDTAAEEAAAEAAAEEAVAEEEMAEEEAAEEEAAEEEAAEEEAAEEEAAEAAAAEPEETETTAGQASGSGSTGTAGTTAADGQGTTVQTVRTETPEPGILGTVKGMASSLAYTVSGLVGGLGLGGLVPPSLQLPVLGAVVVVLLLLAMLVVRRRRAGGDDDGGDSGPEGTRVARGGDAEADDDYSALFEEGAEEAEVSEGDTGLTDTLSTAAASDEDEDAEAAMMSEAFNLDDLDDSDETMTAETASESDDDTLSEADVYLAYGLHQQAEDLLKLAIEEQPDRIDYRAKLLEAIYGSGRTEDFVQQAQTLRDKVEDTSRDPNWLRVVAMGKELAPDEQMFQQEVDESLKPAAGGATQPPDTDLDLGDEGTDLDFSFGDEGGDGQELDENDDETFGETMMLDAEELQAGAGEDAAAAGPDEAEGEMEFDLGDLDLDETEQDKSGGDDSDLGEDFDFDLGDSGEEAEKGGDADLGDDFDIDLGDSGEAADDEDLPEHSSSSEEAQALADMDLGDLELEGADTADEGGEDEEFEFDLGDEDEAGGEAEAAGSADDLDLSDMDLGDLESLDDEPTDTGEAPAADEEISIGDLEADLGDEDSKDASAPAAGGGGDEDEFGTMLDLARAYIDMGDAESARSALEEVAEGGSDEQRSEAKGLLDSI